MDPQRIKQLRKALKLTQVEFGQLLGAHSVTVSRWETAGSGAAPSAYQLALMQDFERAAHEQALDRTVKDLLVGAGLAAAIYFLLKAARGG